MSVDLGAIRHYVNESAQEYRSMLSKIDEIKLSIQSIRTSPGHSSSILLPIPVASRLVSPSKVEEPTILTSPGSKQQSQAFEYINPITGSIMFNQKTVALKSSNALDESNTPAKEESSPYKSPVKMTKSVTLDEDNEFE